MTQRMMVVSTFTFLLFSTLFDTTEGTRGEDGDDEINHNEEEASAPNANQAVDGKYRFYLFAYLVSLNVCFQMFNCLTFSFLKGLVPFFLVRPWVWCPLVV